MKIAMLYDDDAYLEIPDRQKDGKSVPRGLWGRHVAGKEFFDAYLTHGEWDELVALVRNRASRESVVRLCDEHASNRVRKRRLRVFSEQHFYEDFFPSAPATLLYTPQPPDERYAWAREHGGPGSYALCGVTHTLCSARANRWLISLVTAPFEEYDALVCTSQAVVNMVRTVIGSYTDHLRHRYGGQPRLKPRLELIPLGVNTDRFRPATPEQRLAHRQGLGVHDDEVVVLFVGRLAAHGKAHPFPIFAGLQEASRRTQQKIHLVLSGWAKTDAILQAFADGARVFAPDIRLTILDGTDATIRFGIWQAADIFTSLSDNIQETFGLVIVEAMASGLPVVASDWNGYRDLVTHGETGFLVPTAMVAGATTSSTGKLLMGATNYDRFLGQCNQATVVDLREAAGAFSRLITSADLRARMGAAGRQRALDRFAWSHIIKAYEDLWSSQERARCAHRSRGREPTQALRTPSLYPPPERSFAGYPTRWLDEHESLETTPDAEQALDQLLSLPLANYAADTRDQRRDCLSAVLAAAEPGCTLEQLTAVLQSNGTSFERSRATLAWMLKYGLLQTREESD